MLFNSPVFLFAYLPLVAGAFYLVASRSNRLAVAVLALASLAFYGWFDARLLLLIGTSILFNYAAGRMLARTRTRRPGSVKALLAFAVAANLCLLGYFKYVNFFVGTVYALGGQSWTPLSIVLPIGISFFTFTQVAFLVDAARGRAEEYDFPRYVLFVTYFPHLVAGPIFHHSEMMPQFARFGPGFRFDRVAAAAGLTCFSIGLLKKVGVADFAAPIADVFFDAAKAGAQLSMAEAWTGALAYTFQIYFDFSGYCDMAIGLSLLFGVRLPMNFNSPYKAASIIDFWRRWHMTLSRFLRDYLYIPLGGSRRGPWRRHANLMITMLLGGLWHGAGWTFVAWGALHGGFLVVNHLWRNAGLRLDRRVGWAATFSCVVAAWVFFRADSMASAAEFISAMLSMDGLNLAQKITFPNELVTSRLTTGMTLMAFLFVTLLMPNTQELVARFRPVLHEVIEARLPLWLAWRPNVAWGLATGIALVAGIALMTEDSPFLYFQF